VHQIWISRLCGSRNHRESGMSLDLFVLLVLARKSVNKNKPIKKLNKCKCFILKIRNFAARLCSIVLPP